MRIEAETDVENLGAQRALEKAGFTREGVLRSAQWQRGGWHDLVDVQQAAGGVKGPCGVVSTCPRGLRRWKMMQPVHDLTSDPAPYPPSWFDRFSDWVDGQRFPQWAFYAALTMLSAVGLILFQAIQGAYPDGVINPWHAFFAVQPVFFLGLMHYLDHAAASALDQFRPALAGGEGEYRAARYRLTTLPAQSVRWATLAGILAFLLLLGPTTFQVDSSPFRLAINTTTLQVFDMSTRPATGWVMLAVYLGLWGVIGVLVLHTAHQLREVRRLYAGVKATDPFQPEPLYAFSPVTSLTALLLLLNSYGWMLLLLTGSQATAGGYSLTGGVMVNVFFAALERLLIRVAGVGRAPPA